MTETPEQDISPALLQRITEAAARREPLRIHGGDTKRDLLGRPVSGTALDISGHRGIVHYEPAELVVSVRAGTTIDCLLSALREQGQTLACEPPSLGGGATVGGTLACNLSGPARPWGGAMRDAVLGLEMINGKGQRLNFGGTVMKNVAGYDVSRLQAGAMGTLGVITQINLKVMPLPECVQTLAFECTAIDALGMMRERARQALPLNGACWHKGVLQLRLAGAETAVTHTARQLGGQALAESDTLWRDLRELRLPLFTQATPLWRLSLDPAAPLDDALTVSAIDWAGAQRWVATEADFDTVCASAAAAAGHACLFRGGERHAEVRSPLHAPDAAIQQRLKLAFDPERIFNPGRLYGWM